MNIAEKTARKLDRLQRRNPVTGFIVAVIKKYGEDQAGSQAALLTYYSFLSLFPILLILTSLANLLPDSHAQFQQTAIDSITHYFPVLGNQLSQHVHNLHRSGLALAIGLLFLLYGARGIADAFRNGVNAIWGVPPSERDGFPKSLFKSLAMLVVGGLGFMTASICTALAGSAGHGLAFRLLSLFVNLFILFWLFSFLINMSLPKHVSLQDTELGAAAAAIGLVVLQFVGRVIITKLFKNLDALYSYFALSLGLLAWLYLQAQVLYYAIEIASVKSRKLWPRILIEGD